MRRLILLRHAKSSWAAPGLNDIDRPLNARGLRDAPKMAARLAAAGGRPELIICSTAARTRETVAACVEAFDLPAAAVRFSEELYLAAVTTAQRIIMAAPAEVSTLLLVGHNPTFTELANRHGDVRIDNVPTCGCVTLELNIHDWSALANARGRTLNFDYPKRAAN